MHTFGFWCRANLRWLKRRLADVVLNIADIVCVVCRPEMKFNGIGALIARIKTDAGIAAKQLDETTHQQITQDSFLHGQTL